MKVALKITFVVVVALLLVQPSSVLAQKGSKPSTIELYAEFRDAKDASGNFTDKIHSDGKGFYFSDRSSPGYPNDAVLNGGPLYLRIQKHRSVVFEFSTPSRTVPIDAQGQVTCREYDLAGADPFTFPAPAFLTQGAGIPNNDITFVTTQGEFKFNASTGVWDYTESTFNLATMAVGTMAAYVALNFEYHIIEQDEPFDVRFGYKLWAGLSPSFGIAKVTHPDSNTWVLESLPAGNPEAPLRALGPDGASLYLLASGIRKVRAGGPCDLGDWVMPFQLTLRRR